MMSESWLEENLQIWPHQPCSWRKDVRRSSSSSWEPQTSISLNLQSEDLALICIMRCGIVPLAVLYILELVLRWNLVLWLQLDQPFRQ